MITYSIKAEDRGGYSVLVSRSSEKGSYVAINLATRERAARWVKVRKQLDREAALDSPDETEPARMVARV